jgi:predicted nucleic acid-binding protein
VARGIRPFDAAYVALAEQLGCRVVTDDRAMVRAAPGVAVELVPPG